MRTQNTSVLRRLLYAIFALAWAVASVFVGVEALRLGRAPNVSVTQDSIVLASTQLSQAEQAMWGVGAFASAALALAILGLVVRSPSWLRGRVFVITNPSDARKLGGEISVGAKSIQRVASYVARRVDGVLEANSFAALGRRGWDLDLLVVVPPEATLPEITGRLREALGEALQRHTGVPLARLRILAELEGGGPKPTSKRVV